MNESNVLQLLSCFSKKEHKEFSKFIRSLYHNNRKEVIRFYDLLKKYTLDKLPNNEELFKVMYPKKSYRRNDINKLASLLYKLGKEYLTIAELKADKRSSKLFLLRRMNNHKIDGLFEKELEAAEKLVGETIDSSTFF